MFKLKQWPKGPLLSSPLKQVEYVWIVKTIMKLQLSKLTLTKSCVCTHYTSERTSGLYHLPGVICMHVELRGRVILPGGQEKDGNSQPCLLIHTILQQSIYNEWWRVCRISRNVRSHSCTEWTVKSVNLTVFCWCSASASELGTTELVDTTVMTASPSYPCTSGQVNTQRRVEKGRMEQRSH